MKSKRIFISGNTTRNVYGFRKELVNKLVEDNEVYIAAKLEGSVETLRSIGCNLIELDINGHGTNPLAEMKLVSDYKRAIKEVKPDIVLTYTIKPNIYAGIACASLNVPYVTNISGLGTAVENGGILQKITLPLYKHALRKAKKVFFQNASNRDFMIERGIIKKNASNYDLLPGSGVNLERFAYQEYPHADTIDFVFMARLVKEKGIDQYIDAARAITPKYKNAVFHVYGPPTDEYIDKVKKLTEEGIIIYHGYAIDVISAYKQARCVVHPTFYPEGMSNVLLESCAIGRPIITTDRPGCREIVDNGVNGYVVEQRSSADLIEKIEKFLNLSYEEQKNMGIEARKKVEREFDRNIVIEKYMKEIESV